MPAGALIDALASVDKDSEALPDDSGADVVIRTSFRQSALYASFVDHRTRQMIEKAEKSTGQARMDALASAKLWPGLSAGMVETIALASTIFD